MPDALCSGLVKWPGYPTNHFPVLCHCCKTIVSAPLFPRAFCSQINACRSFQCSPPTLVPQRISPLSPSLLFRDLSTPPCMAENAAKYVDPIGKNVQLDEALVVCESHLSQLNDG